MSGDDAAHIRLELTGLSPFGQLAWLSLASSAVVQAGCARRGAVRAGGLHAGVAALVDRAGCRWPLDGAVAGDSAPVPAGNQAFTFITGARALTVKLVAAVPPIVIEPAEPGPVAVDPRIYWATPGDAGVLPRLRWLVEALADPAAAEAFERYVGNLGPASRTVSLLTSVFRGDQFLDGFLENAAALDGYGGCEHFLIRPGSPGDEHARLLAHVRAWPAAIYINLPHDPGLYETWNLAARLSTARYLSNANLDDRRAPAHVRRLCAVLDERPDVDVASAPLRITHEPNTDWAEVGEGRLMFGDVPPGIYGGADLLRDDGERLRSRNLPHCMPVWRRELHARVGFFDEARFGPSADWEFWLRAGARGARFHFADEPLGVFLRTPDSYWQQGSVGYDYDRLIAAFYRGLWDGTDWVGRQRWPSSSELRALREAGADLELTGRFAVLVEEAQATNRGARPVAVDNLAQRLFGLPDAAAFDRLRGIHSSNHRVFAGALRAFVLDVCDGQVLAPHGVSWLWALTLEGLRLDGDWAWNLVCARVVGIAGDREGEWRRLRELHAQDRERFWRLLQPVYRFTVTLERMAELVDDAVQAPDPCWPSAVTCDVCFYPDYRDTNVYQSLLYDAFERDGARVVGTSDPGALLDWRPGPGREAIVHIHWDDAIHKKWDAPIAAQRRAYFLALLRRLRARGCRLYWTVHNQLSHECKDPAAERAFRRALYALVDRVYVHHPLVPEALDWLPGRDKLSLVEHGPYPVKRADRAAARAALGVEEGGRVLLHFGVVRAYKAVERTLPALRQALDRHPALTVVVVGRIQVREVRRYLSEHPHPRLIVDDAGVSDERLAEYVAVADGGFLSYRGILTSGALFHMLSYGLPPIAPALGTIPAYVDDGWNGYRYTDMRDLDAAVDRFMALSRARLSRLQANAARTADALHWRFP